MMRTKRSRWISKEVNHIKSNIDGRMLWRGERYHDHHNGIGMYQGRESGWMTGICIGRHKHTVMSIYIIAVANTNMVAQIWGRPLQRECSTGIEYIWGCGVLCGNSDGNQSMKGWHSCTIVVRGIVEMGVRKGDLLWMEMAMGLSMKDGRSANRWSNGLDQMLESMRLRRRRWETGSGTLRTWADPYGLIHAGLACFSRAQHDRMLASSSYVGEQAINIRRRTTWQDGMASEISSMYTKARWHANADIQWRVYVA